MAANEVDSMLVPGMMEMKVSEALPKLETMCNEMKESTILCQAVTSRLRFLHGHPNAIMGLDIPATYADAIGTTIKLVRNNSSKDLMHRIAASRSALSGLHEIHQKINRLFENLQLANAPEMADWKDNWDDGVHKQTEQFLNNLTSYQPSGDASTIEEAVTMLKYELEKKREENSDEHIKVIEAALEIQGLPIVPDLPTNFILRDDLDVQAESFGEGSIGAVFDGMLGRQKQRVAVKRFFLDSKSVQLDFLQETRIAHTLDHPNILRSIGACHVGNPVFTVCEYAAQGNLLTYFANPAHRSDFWQLFLEAAQGLLYLHKRSVIHGGLRCSNILVSSDGTAKISDAGYGNIRRMSVGRSLKGGINSTRWMAPECLLEQGRNAEPSFESDIYSLGMTIIEAKTGKHPWPDQETDENIIDILADEAVYERPQEHFTPKEWELVMALCQCDRTARIPLGDAIEILTGFASTRHYCQNPSCPFSGPDTTRFCGECGAALVMSVPSGIEMDRLTANLAGVQVLQ